MEVSYDSSSDLVTIEGDLMVPLPVYNYARYIKEACVCWTPSGIRCCAD